MPTQQIQISQFMNIICHSVDDSIVSICKLLLLYWVKVGVIEGILRCDSLDWVINQHLFHQVNSLCRYLLARFVQFSSLPFGEGCLEVLELRNILPCVRVRGAHHLENLEYLVDLWVSTEENLFVGDFIKYAGNWPDIHSGVVNLSS